MSVWGQSYATIKYALPSRSNVPYVMVTGISPGIKLTTPSLIDSTRIFVDFPFFSGRAALTTGLATATQITGLDQSNKLLCTISYQALNVIPKISVADPGCLSPDPGSWFLPIPDPDPKTATKRGEKICCPTGTFFVATNITKLINILILNWWRKKFVPIYDEV